MGRATVKWGDDVKMAEQIQNVVFQKRAQDCIQDKLSMIVTHMRSISPKDFEY